jgi:hypothetical protein
MISDAAIATVNAAVYENYHISAAGTEAIAMEAASTSLLATVEGHLARGGFPPPATPQSSWARQRPRRRLRRRQRATVARRPVVHRHIGVQFVAESALLAATGGTAGAILGGFTTIVHAAIRHWNAIVLPGALALAVTIAVAAGAAAGTYPAVKAVRLSPADALRSV